MKRALFIAAGLCLAGAAVFALAPVEAPELALDDAPPPAPIDELPIAEARAPEAAAAELEPARVDELEDPSSAPLVISGRVNPSSGAQPEVHLVLQAQCAPGDGDDCVADQLDIDADPDTGEFSAEVYPATWRIVARADGFLPAHEEGLAIGAGEELGDLVMTLERGERITGTVVREGEPVADASITATGQGYTRLAFTDEFGRFAIEGLPRGTFSVLAFSGPIGGDEKRVTTGSSVHLSLDRRLRVRVRVLDARGFPVEGAAVFSDYEPVSQTESDPFPVGRREVLGLGMHGCAPAPGCYERGVTGADGRFELDASPGEALIIGARLGARAAVMTDVTPGGDVDLTLEAGERIQLLDERGQPAAFEELETRPLPPFFPDPPKTGADGWADLPAGVTQLRLPPGSHLAGSAPRGIRITRAYEEDLIY